MTQVLSLRYPTHFLNRLGIWWCPFFTCVLDHDIDTPSNEIQNNSKGFAHVPGNDISAIHAWFALGATGANITICTIEDGLHVNHPDFANKLTPGASYDVVHDTPVMRSAATD